MTIFHAGTGAVNTVASGNCTPGAPSGLVFRLNDVFIAVIAYRGAANFTLPASWVNIQTLTGADVANPGIAGIVTAYYVMTTLTLPSFVFTRTGGDVATGRVAVFRGVDTTTPVDVSAATQLAANSTTITAPTITTNNNASMILFCTAGGDDITITGQTAATAPTTGWVESFDALTTTGADTGHSLAYATQTTAGATGQLSGTASRTGRHCGVSIALKPSTTPYLSLPPTPSRLMRTALLR